MEYGKITNQKDTLYYDGFVKIYETALATTASSISITGLNGNVDVEYILDFRTIGGIGNPGNQPSVYPNNDTTAGNYGEQGIYGLNTTIGAQRETSHTGWYGCQYAGGVTTQNPAFATHRIYAKTGYVRTCLSSIMDRVDAGTTVYAMNLVGQSWADTTNNITSIVLANLSTSGYGVSTAVFLYAKRSRL
jgi:hypothetical protein